MANQSLIPFVIAGTVLCIILSAILVYLMVFVRRKLKSYSPENHTGEMRVLALRLQESERMLNRIACNIHDQISQPSVAIRMRLETLKNRLAYQNDLESLDASISHFDKMIQQSEIMRQLLNSDYVETTGLAYVIEKDARRILEPMHEVLVKVNGNVEQLNSEQKLLIYRIANEAFHNIAKHAGATCVAIAISHMGNRFVLFISDNGYGIPKERLYISPGNGLIEMKERARCLHGNFTIQSTPGSGCTIKLSIENIPVKEN